MINHLNLASAAHAVAHSTHYKLPIKSLHDLHFCQQVAITFYNDIMVISLCDTANFSKVVYSVLRV